VTRALAAAVALGVAGLVAAPTAAGQDSLAPPGAPKHWLPNEQWVNLLWLPYDEARLYDLVGHDRGFIFRWVRDEKTLAELGRRRGWTPDTLAAALVSPRRDELRPHDYAIVRERAERTLTQGHLGQHLLFHALHQTAVPAKASQIFGTPTRERFLRLRRDELSPLQIGELHGRTRVEMARETIRTLREAAELGVREGTLTERQAAVMLDRQLRSVPRWLGQSRYNGPSGGRNRKLPAGDFARHPSISADGSTVVWDAYRATIAEAERLGEIHVRGARLDEGVRFPVTVGRPDPRRPRSAYNCVLSATGRSVAFESSESTYPLAKRVGQMTVMVKDLTTGSIDHVSHEHRGPDPPSRTAFNPSLSADGSLVVFEATDAGEDGRPSRNGLWLADRRSGWQRLIADGSVGAAYLPRLSGDGRTVVYTSAAAGSDGFTRVFAQDLRSGRTTLVARAGEPRGAPADSDAYDPAISHDGRWVAFVSRARNLGGSRNGRSTIYVRDRRTGSTERVSGRLAGRDAASPAISRTGRYVVFLAREGTPDGTLGGLRSSLWLHDRRSGRTRLVSRAHGRAGAMADGYNSEPAVSADGRRVAFTSTAGNLSTRKPKGLPGVFVRDLRAGTTVLLSTHRPRKRADARQGLMGARIRAWSRRLDSPLALVAVALAGGAGAGILAMWRRRRRWAG
jgi:Tol biopolymer transport system component